MMRRRLLSSSDMTILHLCKTFLVIVNTVSGPRPISRINPWFPSSSRSIVTRGIIRLTPNQAFRPLPSSPAPGTVSFPLTYIQLSTME